MITLDPSEVENEPAGRASPASVENEPALPAQNSLLQPERMAACESQGRC